MTSTNSPYDSDSDATTELLRQALSAEAAEVQPSPDALRSIQQRTGAGATSSPSPFSDSSDPARGVYAGSTRTNRGRRRPSWMLGVVGAAAATAAVITAVVVIGDQGADPSRTPAASPGTTASQPDVTTEPAVDPPTATPTPNATNAPAGEQVTIYYVGPTPSNPRLTPRLYAEPHTISSSGGGWFRAVAAVREFFTSKPLDSDYSTGWPAGVEIRSITQDGDMTTIHLFGEVDIERLVDESRAEAEMAVQALVATAGVKGPVDFTYNGARIDNVLGVATPVALESELVWRAMVSITSPVEGETVDSPVTVEGSANVYEANLNWELLDADGKVIDDGYTMAGAYEWAPFTIELGRLDPGTYTIRAFESSAEDGSMTHIDDKNFTVR